MLKNISSITDKFAILKDKYILSGKYSISEEINLVFDDTKYKKYFENILGPMIYEFHINSNLTCCAFCSWLKRSKCHKFCSKCSKGVYEECSPLLPGTFSFSSNILDSSGEEQIPWIFKTPCTGFERITGKKCFKNFISKDRTITITNYEVLEGLFTGVTRGKKPCHICASASLDMYKQCSEQGSESKTCNKVSKYITDKYEVISGMIKIIE
jgi:hypothetical protein